MRRNFVAIPLHLVLLAASIYPAVVSSSAAGQETLIGVVGQDFVILGADSSSSSSVALTSSNLDKIMVLSDPFPVGRRRRREVETASADDQHVDQSWEQQPIAAAAAGDSADADSLLGLLAAHCTMREYEAGVGCDVEIVYDGSSRWPLPSATGPESSAAAPSASLLRSTAPSGLDAEAVAHLARAEIAQSLRSRGQLKVCLLIAGMVRAAPLSRRKSADSQHGDKHNLSYSNHSNQEDSTFSARIRRQIEAAASSFGHPAQSTSTSSKSGASFKEDVLIDTQQQRKQNWNSNLVPRLFWLDEYGSIQRLEYGAHGYASNFALSILDRGYRPDMTREEASALVRDCFDQLRTRYVINSPNPPCIKCIDSNGCSLV